jgi:hypothetical protein
LDRLTPQEEIAVRFDRTSLSLYTDAGELIKVLHCPLKKRWHELGETESAHRTCSNCERAVLDTSAMTEAEVVTAVRDDPHTCLCVSAGQANLTLLPLRLSGRPETRTS